MFQTAKGKRKEQLCCKPLVLFCMLEELSTKLLFIWLHTVLLLSFLFAYFICWPVWCYDDGIHLGDALWVYSCCAAVAVLGFSINGLIIDTAVCLFFFILHPNLWIAIAFKLNFH